MELSVKVSAGILFSLLACGSAVSQFFIWSDHSRTSLQEATEFYDSEKIDVNHYVHGIEYPQIIAESQSIALHEDYDPLAWVSVQDAQDGDISDQVHVYGEIDNSRTGEYEIRYVVRNSYGLKSTKHIKVLVT